MKTISISYQLMRKLALTALGTALFMAVYSQAPDRDFYQMKVYSLDNDQQENRMDNYLEKAYIPALHRAGIEVVGVFKQAAHDENQGKKIFVLIPFKSLNEFEALPSLLDKDKKYSKTGEDYIAASHDNAAYARIESILLRAFKGMPEYGVPDHPTAKVDRIYELRSYEGATEKIYERKVEMFNDAGEIELFVELGFQPVFFGEVISGSSMPNLMYMTTFSNRESQDEHWNAFRTSTKWTKMKEIEKYKNTVSNSVKYHLHPTVYSDL